MFQKVLRRSTMFCEILSRSKAFSWILSSSERFSTNLRFLWNFGCVIRLTDVFRSLLLGSQQFLKVSECYDLYDDVLWCSLAFWGVLMCSHWFLIVLKGYYFFCLLWCSCVLWGVIWHSEVSHGFCKGLNCLEGVWAVIRRSGLYELFWDILMSSERFWKDPEGLRYSLTFFWVFWGFLSYSQVFWAVMKDSWKFRSVILRCMVTWDVFVSSYRLLKVLRRYLDFLECSVLFGNDFMVSESFW